VTENGGSAGTLDADGGAGGIGSAVCGNGILESGEHCDDGNVVAGDGCSPLCELEEGWVCIGEPGNYTCHVTVCGDGVVEGSEVCDDGNDIDGDGCSSTCTVEDPEP
jgi:cysteine-rich repeat protein